MYDEIKDIISELYQENSKALSIWWFINVMYVSMEETSKYFNISRYQIYRINKRINKRIKNDSRYLKMARKADGISKSS